MLGPDDREDQRNTRIVAVSLVVLVLVLIAAILWLAPDLVATLDPVFSPGLGLKSAAIISFFLTIGTLVLFMLAAGDGLIGELQFALAAFFTLFIFLWLMLAWIF